MPLTAPEMWSRLLDHARQNLPEQTFRTWLEPTEALTVENGTIIVGTPDRFAADWNDSKHAELLASYAPVALGHPIKIVFRVDEERKTRPQMDFFVAPPPDRGPQESATPDPGASQLSARYTFQNFVIGKSNELAAAAARLSQPRRGRCTTRSSFTATRGSGRHTSCKPSRMRFCITRPVPGCSS